MERSILSSPSSRDIPSPGRVAERKRYWMVFCRSTWVRRAQRGRATRRSISARRATASTPVGTTTVALLVACRSATASTEIRRRAIRRRVTAIAPFRRSASNSVRRVPPRSSIRGVRRPNVTWPIRRRLQVPHRLRIPSRSLRASGWTWAGQVGRAVNSNQPPDGASHWCGWLTG